MKRLAKITNKQITERGVQALSDRPNVVQQYGQSGMSATQLKIWFDNLATFLAQKLNAIIDTIADDSAAEYIRILLDDYGIDNLGSLVNSFTNGEFASKVLLLYPNAGARDRKALQEIINGLAQDLSKAQETADTAYKKSVDRTEITYQRGESGTTPPMGEWSASIPPADDGQFIWTRVVIYLRDETTTTAYSVSRMGPKGDKGDRGEKGDKGDRGDDFFMFSVRRGHLYVATETATSRDVSYSMDARGHLILTLNR